MLRYIARKSLQCWHHVILRTTYLYTQKAPALLQLGLPPVERVILPQVVLFMRSVVALLPEALNSKTVTECMLLIVCCLQDRMKGIESADCS